MKPEVASRAARVGTIGVPHGADLVVERAARLAPVGRHDLDTVAAREGTEADVRVPVGPDAPLGQVADGLVQGRSVKFMPLPSAPA